ncbi:MAG TPA: SulP family inorganic anion transporter [Noviherbaspirillum sp.]
MHLPPGLKRALPFLRWPRPTRSSFRQDAWAGVSVGLVLVPQAVAYATLAGMPAETGLYAALLPAIVGILWGSSGLLAVGPVALTSLLTFGSLSSLATPGSATWVGLAIWLSLYSGIMQFALGAFRLGRIANLVSQPVMAGFINAAAIIIIFSQLPALLGLANPDAAGVAEFASRMSSDPLAAVMPAAFGCGALVFLLAVKRLFPALPGVLLITIIGIAASMVIDYEGLGGKVVGTIVAGLPPLMLPPSIPLASHQELWPAALVVALISFTEAMSSCRVIAQKKNVSWDENQELIGQGLAKIASGVSGAFPVSGSFSRSALNLYAGATSGWSTLIATLCVLVSLLFLTDLIHYLPRSILAAMVIVPVLSLINFSVFGRLYRLSKTDGAIAVVTFLVTLMSMPRLHWGVVAGVGLTMASYLYRRSDPRIVEVGMHEDGTLRDRSRFDLPPLADDLLAARIDAALNFLTAPALERYIMEYVKANPRVRRVLLCSNGINSIDTTGMDALERLHLTLAGDGIELYLSAVKKQVWDMLERSHLPGAMGPGHVFATDAEAVAGLTKP